MWTSTATEKQARTRAAKYELLQHYGSWSVDTYSREKAGLDSFNHVEASLDTYSKDGDSLNT